MLEEKKNQNQQKYNYDIVKVRLKMCHILHEYRYIIILWLYKIKGAD